ncbi:MAG: ABC transporter ATP-binding protein [Trueperaceae bacterium]|nr:ABC transporter ATP-binding protein [Trueperaceae bacterium]
MRDSEPREPALRVRGLGKDYGGRPALVGLDLEVAHGEIVALLGHNGAGKTTTVRLLNGVLTPDRGEARVLGLDPWTQGTRLRARTGIATERPSLDPRLTARANLRLYAALYGVPRESEASRIDAVLDRFGLVERANDRVGSYSKGMMQRLALARCALHEPDLYFLDEPSAGLDPLAARELRSWIADLAAGQGRTVLICTHDLGEAQRLADRVAVLREGELAALGTPGELATRYGAARLEVEVPEAQADDARAALADHGFVLAGPSEGEEAVPPETSRLHVAAAGRDRAPDVARVLLDAGISLIRLDPADASLEDVYLAVYGGAP